MNAIFSGEMTNRDCGYTNCANYAGFTNGAAAIEDTKTGQLLALMGSRDFNYSGFGQDNAATAFIQPGSSIKPFVYAQLFSDQGSGKQNYGSGSILADTKTTFTGNYTPQNADNKFQGNINLRQALDRSRNIPAIKAMAINEQNNSGSTWSLIRNAGNQYYCTNGSDAQAGLSSAIGSCGTRLIDHVNAYATLSRQGSYTPQTTILKVTNSDGETLKEYEASSKQVIDQQAAYIVTDILGDASARAGLGWNQDYLPTLTGIGVHTAVKTGTSNGELNGKVASKDIWAAGYTPSLSMAVWFGNSDTSLLKNGNSLIPAMFFDKTMATVSQMYSDQSKLALSDWYTAPSGIQTINGQIYPSYYNKSTGVTTDKMTFDKVSKKKATDCTPDGAKIEIGVTKTTDAFTKKEIVTSSDASYDPNSNDDVHQCDDAKPTVSVSSSADGSVTVTYTHGRYQLQSIEVTSGGTVIASRQVTSNGTWTLTASDLAAVSNGSSVSATVTDEAYYTSSGSASYRKSSSSN